MAEKIHEKRLGGFLVVAGLFLGIGAGILYDQTAAGTLIGVGAGFLLAFIYGLFKK